MDRDCEESVEISCFNALLLKIWSIIDCGLKLHVLPVLALCVVCPRIAAQSNQ